MNVWASILFYIFSGLRRSINLAAPQRTLPCVLEVHLARTRRTTNRHQQANLNTCVTQVLIERGFVVSLYLLQFPFPSYHFLVKK